MFEAQSQLLPGWGQSFAVTTPWREELDKVVACRGHQGGRGRGKRRCHLGQTHGGSGLTGGSHRKSGNPRQCSKQSQICHLCRRAGNHLRGGRLAGQAENQVFPIFSMTVMLTTQAGSQGDFLCYSKGRSDAGLRSHHVTRC